MTKLSDGQWQDHPDAAARRAMLEEMHRRQANGRSANLAVRVLDQSQGEASNLPRPGAEFRRA
jgi:hypothetical protein